MLNGLICNDPAQFNDIPFPELDIPFSFEYPENVVSPLDLHFCKMLFCMPAEPGVCLIYCLLHCMPAKQRIIPPSFCFHMYSDMWQQQTHDSMPTGGLIFC